MKKAIVLFISLLFIATVSLLILKNLEDTDSYVSEQNSKFSKTQIMFLLNNTKDEMLGVLKFIAEQNTDENKQREVLKDYVGVNFPIIMEDAKITIRLEEYDKYNIKLLNEKNRKTDEQKESYKAFVEYLKGYFINVEGLEILLNDLVDDGKIENNKQLDLLFEKFEKESYNIDISKVKDYIGFQDYDKKEIRQNDRDKEIKFYELFVKVEYLKQFAKAYYILNKSGGVEYFEFSFK